MSRRCPYHNVHACIVSEVMIVTDGEFFNMMRLREERKHQTARNVCSCVVVIFVNVLRKKLSCTTRLPAAVVARSCEELPGLVANNAESSWDILLFGCEWHTGSDEVVLLKLPTWRSGWHRLNMFLDTEQAFRFTDLSTRFFQLHRFCRGGDAVIATQWR
eukprot:3973105-Amphidinium_carterae.1